MVRDATPERHEDIDKICTYCGYVKEGPHKGETVADVHALNTRMKEYKGAPISHSMGDCPNCGARRAKADTAARELHVLTAGNRYEQAEEAEARRPLESRVQYKLAPTNERRRMERGLAWQRLLRQLRGEEET